MKDMGGGTPAAAPSIATGSLDLVSNVTLTFEIQ
jgi:hypothetical protein